MHARGRAGHTSLEVYTGLYYCAIVLGLGSPQLANLACLARTRARGSVVIARFEPDVGLEEGVVGLEERCHVMPEGGRQLSGGIRHAESGTVEFLGRIEGRPGWS